MSADSKSLPLHRLARRAFSLGAVKAFDNAMQFVLPVVLVRCLDTATFGEYRLLWLAVGTLLGIVLLGMPAALYYFLPRSDPESRRLYVHQSLAFLSVAGLLAAFVVSPLSPWIPQTLQPLMKYGALVPAFVALWVTTALLDSLPTAEERIGLQAFATISVTLARAVLLAAAAWLTGDLVVMLWLLVAVALLKLSLLLAYIGRFHGWTRPWFRREKFAGQIRYAAPIGIASSFHVLRGQADQWIAATLFTLHSFAALSIAAVVWQVVHLFRSSVVEVFAPSLSRLEASGDVKSMLAMNARANEMVGWLLYPLLGFTFVFASDIVILVYTAAYIEAATVMRVYIVGLAVLVIEVGSMLQLLRQGMFLVYATGLTLVVSIPLSWFGALAFGLPGAAVGTVVGLYLDRVIALRRIATLSGVPVREQQRWRALAQLVGLAALSAAIAWGVVHIACAGMPPFVRLCVGSAVLALAYGWATRRRWARWAPVRG